MDTVTEIIAQFKETYPDCPDARAATLFSEVYREVCATCEIRKKEVIVSLTAFQREYAIGDGMFDIYEAYYELSALSFGSTNFRVLQAMTYDRLAENNPGGLDSTAYAYGGPVRYYVSSAESGATAENVIGFDPPPDTTTVDGYPRVRCVCNVWEEPAGSDTIPSSFLSSSVFIAGMCLKWAQRKHPDDIARHEVWYNGANGVGGELQKNIAHVKGTTMQADTMFSPNQWRRRPI